MVMVGIVGGVGPEASNYFCNLLIKCKRASSDQENIPFIHFCNPKIPDRTDFIMGDGEDPTDEITKTCKILGDFGANFLVIPCNTAHYFLPEVQKNIQIPILDMTKLLVKRILDEYPPIKKVGILATTGSISAGIYQKYFDLVGVETVIPSIEDQEKLVMGAIYGKNGIKAGKKMYPKKKLIEVADKLIDQGAEVIILGCTEIPLVLKQRDFDIKLFDPMEISARVIVNHIEQKQKDIEFVPVEFSLEELRRSQKVDLSS